MTIQQLYDTAPKVVQAQVDAILGKGARSVSPDAGRPWKMEGIGRVMFDD